MRTTAASKVPTVIICPGNGCSNIRQSNWYGELYNRLTEKDVPCICDNFPDPLNARRDRWVPFMRSLAEKAQPDDPHNVILVGHSSGAQAVLRYTEIYSVRANVLVSSTYSDLGDAGERASGYYPQKKTGTDGQEETNPYEFESMKKNCQNWHQFHSDDDPFIPLHEAEQIRDGLGLSDTYHMLPGRSHYFEYQPELLEVVLSLC
jgi:predicted alpha/beta hydrolase family esterase